MELALSALKRHRKHVQELLGDRLDLRYTPRLTFVADHTPAQAQRIEMILHHLAQESTEAETPEDSADDTSSDSPPHPSSPAGEEE